jgi:cobalt-zinc-cadmium efflux system membrane fusion protein
VVADYGARVAAGEVLAWIDSPDLGSAQAEYRKSLSAARVQEAEYERARLLLDGRAISRGELLRREGSWQAARAELESATQTLHLLGLTRSEVDALGEATPRSSTVYPVRSPIAGRVTERSASVGGVVAPDTQLFVVAELDVLWLTLQVFEKDLPAVAVGSAVSLQCESHPQDRFEGEIDFVADVVDPHSRTIAARAVIDNVEGELKPGMFVYAEITAGDIETVPRVLSVPLSSVVDVGGRDSVFIVLDDGVFELRDVRVGRRWGEWVEVVEGLSTGEPVVVAGTFTLKSEVLEGELAGHDH